MLRYLSAPATRFLAVSSTFELSFLDTNAKMDATDMFGFPSRPAPEPDESIPADRPKKKKRKHATAPEPTAIEEPPSWVKAIALNGDKHDRDNGEDMDKPALKKLRIKGASSSALMVYERVTRDRQRSHLTRTRILPFVDRDIHVHRFFG